MSVDYLQKIRDTRICGTAKTDKSPVSAPFVSFVSNQNSVFVEKKPIRTRLLELVHAAECARGSYIDHALIHRLSADVLNDLAGETDNALLAYLTALADSADRQAGRVPAGHDSAVLCVHCGPVFVHPDVTHNLPEVNGWKRVQGCPWCNVHRAFPRPKVKIDTCAHFVHDHVNPPGGTGKCLCGYHLPFQYRECGQYQPLINQ